MKLNIEELARESGYRFADDDGYDRMKNHGEYQRRWLKSFARLIVERCAQECDKKNPHPDQWSDQQEFAEKRTAIACAAAIRNLMED